MTRMRSDKIYLTIPPNLTKTENHLLFYNMLVVCNHLAGLGLATDSF